MHFDDRLATVLRLRAAGPAVARIQFRQLVDLLGTLPNDFSGPQVDSAYQRLGELSQDLPADERSRIVHDLGLRLRNPRLVAALGSLEPQVAEAAISRANLSENEWLDLAPALPIHARGTMRARRDLGPRVEERMARLGIGERGLPAPAAEPGTAPEADDPVVTAPPVAESGIGAIVRRIEDFRRARDAGHRPANDSPRLPLDEPALTAATPLRAIDFASDADHRVTWASRAVAPMLVGIHLGDDGTGALTGDLAPILRRRQPIRGERIALDGAEAVAGSWRIDATPRFDPVGGRFIGYIGRLRRPAPRSADAPTSREAAQGDRIRQLLHELRTPVNAIQGFAEVIQQQLFGPSPHEYRALAAGIASDAARILAGFDDLERLARLDSGALAVEEGRGDLGNALAATIAQLSAFTGPRDSPVVLTPPAIELPVAIASAEVERLVWRLLAALSSATAPGETLRIAARSDGARAVAEIRLPAALASRSDDELFNAGPTGIAASLSPGMFGTGFALRLARSEARGAGGSLERRGEALVLDLPGLTASGTPHSEEASKRA